MSLRRFGGGGNGPSRLEGTPTLAQVQLADSPLAQWLMQEPSGTTMIDSSGNGRNGTWSNVTLAQSPLDSNAAYSASFNGTSSKGVMTYAAWMDTSNWTIEILVNATSWTSYRGPMGRWGLGTNDVWSFLVNAGQSYLAARNSTTTFTASGGTTLSTGVTYLLAGTWDVAAGKLTSWVNGSLWAQQNISGNAQSASKDITIGIGNTGTQYWFAGKLSHAAVYGTALSSTRLLAHAQAAGLA